MKRFMIWATVASLTLTPTAPAWAQSGQQWTIDHWLTREECQEADWASFYKPTPNGKKCQMDKGDTFGDISPGCYLMDLPDRISGGKPNWVRLSGGPGIFDSLGAIKAHGECCNKIYAQAPLRLPTAHASQPPPLLPSTPSNFGRVDAGTETIVVSRPPPPSQATSQNERDDRDFLDRHGKKLLAAGAIAGGLALLAALFANRQEVDQRTNVCVGPMCR